MMLRREAASPIPLVDLRTHHDQNVHRYESAVREVLARGDFILGRELADFETDYAAYCQVPHAIGVASGLAALHLALVALGIKAGDEVITAANTYPATVLAILHAGATPVLVDVDERSFNLDPDRVEAAITRRTRAVLPVHLYGQPAAMYEVRQIARRHRLLVLEDAAQAHGARFNGRRAGGLGHAGCFSFYPAKNLGAVGDGGIVTTTSAAVARRLRRLRNYGQRKKYDFAEVGFNERLDTLQAAILGIQLRQLDAWNDSRRRHAAYYARALADLPLRLPAIAPNCEHVFHLYVVRTRRRRQLIEHLAKASIAAGIHYPVPAHRQPAFASQQFARQRFPVTERLAREIVSLPMYPELTEPQLARIVDSIHDFFRRGR